MEVKERVYFISFKNYLQDLVIIPGYSEALLVAYNGDNGGPYDKDHYNNLFKKVQSWFPSTFDAHSVLYNRC